MLARSFFFKKKKKKRHKKRRRTDELAGNVTKRERERKVILVLAACKHLGAFKVVARDKASLSPLWMFCLPPAIHLLVDHCQNVTSLEAHFRRNLSQKIKKLNYHSLR